LNKTIKTIATALAIAAGPLLTGCFTGVESTPKITYKDVKDKQAGEASAEDSLASSFVPGKFAQWQNGKKLYVTSDRISLVLTTENSGQATPTEGDTIVYQGSRVIPNLTGEGTVELLFTQTGATASDTLAYNTNATPEALADRSEMIVPFTIDLDLVDKVRHALAGKELYIKSPFWFDLGGNAVQGNKFVKVRIGNVLPANEIYPFMVIFSDAQGLQRAIYMSAGAGTRWMPREFGSLFTFTDPRLSYPNITDPMWTDITHARVSKGMTKTEASLALGTPRNIDRGHDHTSVYERWTYSDGVYLIFEDGLLVRFNK